MVRDLEKRIREGGRIRREEAVEVHRTRKPEAERLLLHYRFVLEPDVRPGSYQLPIHASAVPL